MIKIKEVNTLNELKKFVQFPYRLYSGNPYWVPPLFQDELNTLRKDRNPAFEYCEAKYWVAYRDDQIVGRIAGIINNKYIEKWKNRYVRFGWLDFVDDFKVLEALMETVENWAKSKEMEGIHGPLGFCDLDREGMLIKGFDELSMTITNYNASYYPVYIERLGFKKDVDWVEYEIKIPEKLPERILKINDMVLKRLKLKILPAKGSKDFLPYAEEIFAILNDAYKGLYGVVELTGKQIKAYIKQYFSFVNPDYIKVVLDQNDKVVAYGIAMPSLSSASKKSKGKLLPFGFLHFLKAIKKNNRLDLYLVATKPELQGKGINTLVLVEINKSAIKNGLKYAETGPELEENKDVQGLWRFYETRQHKKRRCFLKKIS